MKLLPAPSTDYWLIGLMPNRIDDPEERLALFRYGRVKRTGLLKIPGIHNPIELRADALKRYNRIHGSVVVALLVERREVLLNHNTHLLADAIARHRLNPRSFAWRLKT